MAFVVGGRTAHKDAVGLTEQTHVDEGNALAVGLLNDGSRDFVLRQGWHNKAPDKCQKHENALVHDRRFCDE